MSDYLNVGPCCKCGKEGPDVRNFIILDFEAPQTNTGSGWGCLVCGLPNNGAMSVICDTCVGNGEEVRFVIDGFPAERKRLPIDQVEKVSFSHDEKKHAYYDGFHGWATLINPTEDDTDANQS